MTVSRLVKAWVIVNSASLCMVLVFFVLGLFWDKYWGDIFQLAGILILPLFFHIFYQGFHIGGLVALITLGILIMQVWNLKRERKPISAIWIVGEIFVISVGILDVLPISHRLIGKLYYMIPGW